MNKLTVCCSCWVEWRLHCKDH